MMPICDARCWARPAPNAELAKGLAWLDRAGRDVTVVGQPLGLIGLP